MSRLRCPTPDIAAAQKLYGQTLGLRVSEEDGPLMLYLAGDHRILVYPKPDHSPASFTILNFPVDDIDQAVDELTARGVPIQRYEDFQTDDRGIYRGKGVRSPGLPTPPATSCPWSRNTEHGRVPVRTRPGGKAESPGPRHVQAQLATGRSAALPDAAVS